MSIIANRFTQVVATLIRKGRVENQTEIAKTIGTYSHVVSQIKSGKREPTVNQLQKMVEIYGIDGNFFFNRSKELFTKDKDIEPPQKHIENKLISTLKKDLDDLREAHLINREELKDEIFKLKAQLTQALLYQVESQQKIKKLEKYVENVNKLNNE